MPEDTTDPVAFADGDDGGLIRDADVAPPSGRAGIRALDATDIFNLLCLPPLTEDTDLAAATFGDAASYLRSAGRRAMLLVDPPSSAVDAPAVQDFQATLNLADENAALFFPRLLAPNPLKDNLIEEFAPSGAVAGVFARTDAQRGTWKAAAGTEARIAGVSGLSYLLTDGENGDLNPLGINALRTFPLIGTVVWGARTLARRRRVRRPVEVHRRAAHGAVHRGDAVPRPQVGRLRAQRRGAVGPDPAQRGRVPERPVPPGRVPGHDPRAGVLREVSTRRRRRRRTSTPAS